MLVCSGRWEPPLRGSVAPLAGAVLEERLWRWGPPARPKDAGRWWEHSSNMKCTGSVETGIFSDAALTFFSAADFTYLAAVAIEGPCADVSSDAVKPLKMGKAARLRLIGASSEAGVGGL